MSGPVEQGAQLAAHAVEHEGDLLEPNACQRVLY